MKNSIEVTLVICLLTYCLGDLVNMFMSNNVLSVLYVIGGTFIIIIFFSDYVDPTDTIIPIICVWILLCLHRDPIDYEIQLFDVMYSLLTNWAVYIIVKPFLVALEEVRLEHQKG